MSLVQGDVRLGVVGLRNIGVNHVRRALAVPGARITALSDTDAQRMQTAAGILPAPAQCHATAGQLFQSADVDAVVLALPNHLHASMAIDAMRHGKHVLVEKPLAVNTDEAREMIRVRDETGQLLMVGMNQRFSAVNVAARKAVAAGLIGEVQQCHTRWLRDRTVLWGGARGAWCLTREKSGGGPLIDLGIHKLDQALYIAGIWPDVEQVTGFTTSGIGSREAAARGATYAVEDYAFGLVRFAGGMAMTVEASYFLNRPGEIQETVVYGTKGAVRLGQGDDNKLLLVRTDEGVTATPLEPDRETAVSCVEHFCRVLQGREALIPTAEDGLRGLEIVEAIYRSAGA